MKSEIEIVSKMNHVICPLMKRRPNSQMETTASGRTEITVRRHSPIVWIVLGVAGLIVVSWLLRLVPSGSM